MRHWQTEYKETPSHRRITIFFTNNKSKSTASPLSQTVSCSTDFPSSAHLSFLYSRLCHLANLGVPDRSTSSSSLRKITIFLTTNKSWSTSSPLSRIVSCSRAFPSSAHLSSLYPRLCHLTNLRTCISSQLSDIPRCEVVTTQSFSLHLSICPLSRVAPHQARQVNACHRESGVSNAPKLKLATPSPRALRRRTRRHNSPPVRLPKSSSELI